MDGYHGYVESGASSVNAAVKSELYTYIYPSINQRVSRPTVFFALHVGPCVVLSVGPSAIIFRYTSS